MSDQQARHEAVQIDRSVLVQAPAGSGKTTLLVERYIGLLAVVDAPESILAITFTRKAAAEMRRRILRYLTPGFDEWASHEARLKDKVDAIADRIEAWDLLNNPQRMQIRTIDGFCHSLTKTMPVVGQLGPVPRPADQPQKLYRAAARQALRSDASDQSLESARQTLLAWCDHNAFQVESLIAKLLGQREQWLKLIMPGGHLDRAQQNAYLAHSVEQTLTQARAELDRAIKECDVDLTAFLGGLSEAGHELQAKHSDSPITALAGSTALPAANVASMPLWRGFGEALLTKDGNWRARLTATQGFSPQTTHKQAVVDALNALQPVDSLAMALRQAADQPDPHYSDQDWAILEALVSVLRRAAQHLELVFAQQGDSDFTAIAAAALRGLGNEDDGFSDLALYLDSQIEHILVDEYQDTNHTQFQLIERLIHGWAGEGDRTLFLVGDPMQSIYRFREAEVGLFIKTRDQGIGPVTPEPVRLLENFRSSPVIVDWVNTHLGPLFPTDEDIASGAIAYSSSQSNQPNAGAVTVAPFSSTQAEAEAIADHIESLFKHHGDQPDFKAAIIVRARSHLSAIIPTLQARQIPFRAVKLDKLIDRPVIQDLLALTQAILNPQHRTAVLALMRSPMAGLTLAELTQLTNDPSAPLTRDSLRHLDEDAKRRATRVFEVLDQAQHHRGRRPLCELVEGAWHRLGGSAGVAPNQPHPATDDIERYLDALAYADNTDLLHDWNDFIEWLEQTHTQGNTAGEAISLDILTMHGAKGLEWDAVIIPSLHAQAGRTDTDLLYWLPLPLDNGEEGVLMAPMDAPGQKTPSPLVRLVKATQKRRQTYEALRLMYVATTRAKSNLFLSAVIKPNAADDFKPASGSLLETVWPTLQGLFSLDALDKSATPIDPPPVDGDAEHVQANDWTDQNLYRLPSDFQVNRPPALTWQPAFELHQRPGEIEFNWAGTQARRSGTVIHQLLEAVGRMGIEALTEADLNKLMNTVPMLLRWSGTHQGALADQVKFIRLTVMAVLESPTGQWILSGHHHDAACEYPINGVVDGRLIQAVVDRTFVDQIGERWIIDYKSGYHAGGDLDGFLDQEADRYRDQLTMYRQLFAQRGDERITTALYLPKHDRLKIVD